jgi:hypothetical protein
MYPYMRRKEISDVRRPNARIKLMRDKPKTESSTRKIAFSTSEKGAEIDNELTLDDFGGRSDALGG